MTFRADVDPFNDPAITLLFYIVSVYATRTVLIIVFQKAFAAATRLRMLGRREIFAVCGEAEDAKTLTRVQAPNATKRAVQKRHACLVSWEELDALPQARPAELSRL